MEIFLTFFYGTLGVLAGLTVPGLIVVFISALVAVFND